MSASSSIRDRILSEVKRLCYAGLDEETLLRQAAECIRREVPLDLYCMHTTDPASGLITRGVVSDPAYHQVSRTALERVYFEDDVTPFGWMARRQLPAVSLSESTGGNRERALRYRELMAPLGVEHEVRGVLAHDGALWGCFSAMREPDSPDFNASEVEFFQTISPHLAAGLKAATLRSEALAEPDSVSQPGVLILDRTGRVVQHTRSAECWLRDLGDLSPDWQDGATLPLAISSIAGALKHSIDVGMDDVPRLVVRARSGRWLTLYSALTEPVPDRDGESMVVIEPAGPREVAWLRTSAYGLTEREREVVDLVVRGSTTKQISESLYISEYTVQEHLSNVFEKVGVRGRRALVKRLYLDSLV